MKTGFLKFFSLAVLACVTGVLLSACDPRFEATFNPPVNRALQDYSYDAADKLISKAQYSLAPSTPILIGTLNNVDKLERSSTFGRIIAEQISSRFSQRGFRVAELKMRNSVNIKQGLGDPNESGEFLLSRDVMAISTEHQAGAVVTGTYAVAGKEVYVNLKMIDVATGRIMTGTDFSVPLDGNIDELLGGSMGQSFYGSSMAY